MSDLLISLAAMFLLALIAVIGGSLVQTTCSRRVSVLSQCLVVGLMAAYLTWLWDRPLLIQLLPFSSAIILGNWLPLMGAFLLGVFLHARQVTIRRRFALGTTIAILGSYSLVSPLLGEVPECAGGDDGQQVLREQTTHNTCSAACAAGLLRLHGIPASEAELAGLSLTRRGTHWLGVYRGLKIKTENTEWEVVVEELTRAELLRGDDLEGVLALRFTRESERTADESGFCRNGHTVISLGADRWNTLAVFDPASGFGFESWNDRILKDIEGAILLRLVSRKGTPCPLLRIDTHRPSTWNQCSRWIADSNGLVPENNGSTRNEVRGEFLRITR